MKCSICGSETSSNARYCRTCEGVMMQVVKDVGEEVWSKIEDCSYIYPMVRRVVEGELTVKDVVNEILKGEMD